MDTSETYYTEGAITIKIEGDDAGQFYIGDPDQGGTQGPEQIVPATKVYAKANLFTSSHAGITTDKPSKKIIYYMPSDNGNHEAYLNIYYNGGTTPIKRIKLTGKGAYPTLDFGNVYQCFTKEKTVTGLANGSVATVQEVTYNGTDYYIDYFVSGDGTTWGHTATVGASGNLYVKYQPSNLCNTHYYDKTNKKEVHNGHYNSGTVTITLNNTTTKVYEVTGTNKGIYIVRHTDLVNVLDKHVFGPTGESTKEKWFSLTKTINAGDPCNNTSYGDAYTDGMVLTYPAKVRFTYAGTQNEYHSEDFMICDYAAPNVFWHPSTSNVSINTVTKTNSSNAQFVEAGFRIAYFPTHANRVKTGEYHAQCQIYIKSDGGDREYIYKYRIVNGEEEQTVDGFNGDEGAGYDIGNSSGYKAFNLNGFRGFGSTENGTATVGCSSSSCDGEDDVLFSATSNGTWSKTLTIQNGVGNIYIKYAPQTVQTSQRDKTIYVKDNTHTSRIYRFNVQLGKATASSIDFEDEITVGEESDEESFSLTNFTPSGNLTVEVYNQGNPTNFVVSPDNTSTSVFGQSCTILSSQTTKEFYVRFKPLTSGEHSEIIKVTDVATGRIYEIEVTGTAKAIETEIKFDASAYAQDATFTTGWSFLTTAGTKTITFGSSKNIWVVKKGTTTPLEDIDLGSVTYSYAIENSDGTSSYITVNDNNKTITILGADVDDEDHTDITFKVAFEGISGKASSCSAEIPIRIKKIDDPSLSIAWTQDFIDASNNRSIPVLVRTTSTQTGKMDAANYNTIDLLTKVTYPTGGEVSFSVDATTSSNGSINNDGHTLTIKRGSYAADKHPGVAEYHYPIKLTATLNGTTIYKSKSVTMDFYAGVVTPLPIWIPYNTTSYELKKSDGSNYRYKDEIILSNHFTYTYRFLPSGENTTFKLSQKSAVDGSTIYQDPNNGSESTLWEFETSNQTLDNSKIKVLKKGSITYITVSLTRTAKGLFSNGGTRCGNLSRYNTAEYRKNNEQRYINITFERAPNYPVWDDYLEGFNVSTTYDIKTDVVSTTRNNDDNIDSDKSNITYSVDDNSIATLSGTTLSFQKAGIIEVSVNDPGDNDYYLGLDDDAEKSRKFIVQPNETWDFGSVAKGSDEVITKTFSNFLIFKSGTTREAWTDDSHFEIKDGITYRYASQSNPATITTSSQIEVKFTPTANGAVNGKLYIKETYNGKGYIFIINLHGSGIGFDPVDFTGTTIEVGHASITKSIDLSGISGATSILVSSDKPTIFRVFNAGQETAQCTAISTLAGQAIDATGKSSVNIKYVPETANTNETGTVTVQYVLNGVSKSYTIDVYGKSQASSLAFGSKQLATFAAQQTFTLSNMVTSSNYTITASNPNVFRIDGSSASSVTKNSGGSFTVDFFPLAVASYSETITILDNATSKRYVISASGTATAKSIAFGQVQKGSSSNQSLTISDLPDASSFTTKYSIESSSTAFAVSNASATGATITFTPQQIGSYSGTIYLKDKSSGVLYPLATVSGSCAGTATTESQYIIWNQDLSSLTGSGSVQLSAISTSGLPVTYSISNITGSINSDVSDGTLKFTGAGTATITASCNAGQSSTTLLNYSAASSVSKNVVVSQNPSSGIAECTFSSTSTWEYTGSTINTQPWSPCQSGKSFPYTGSSSTPNSYFAYRPERVNNCVTRLNTITYSGTSNPSSMTFDFDHKNFKQCKLIIYSKDYPKNNTQSSTIKDFSISSFTSSAVFGDQTNVIYANDFTFSSNLSQIVTEHITINLSQYASNSNKKVENGTVLYCLLVVASLNSDNSYELKNIKFTAGSWSRIGNGSTEDFGSCLVGQAGTQKEISVATYSGMSGKITATITGTDADCFRIVGDNSIDVSCSSGGTAKFKVEFVPTKASASGQKLQAQLNVNGPSSSQNVTIYLEGTASKRDLSLNWGYASGAKSVDAIKNNNTIESLTAADNPSVTADPNDLPTTISYSFSSSNESPQWFYSDNSKQKLVDVTYSNGKITDIKATGYGSGTVKIKASVNFAGNSVLNNKTADKELTVTVNKITPTLYLSSSPSYACYGDQDVSITVTAKKDNQEVKDKDNTTLYSNGSSGKIQLLTSNSSIVSVSNNQTLRTVAAGTATITAKLPADAIVANEVTKSFTYTINKTDQHIVASTIPDFSTYNQGTIVTVNLNNYFYAVDKRHSVGTGYDGVNTYLTRVNNEVRTSLLLTYTVTFIPDDNTCPTFATFDNDHTITINGSAAGEIVVMATQAGNACYNPATSAVQRFRVNKLTPSSVTVGSTSSTFVYGGGPYTLTATSTGTNYSSASDNNASFTYTLTVGDGTVASVSGNQLTVLKDGTAKVKATQNANCIVNSSALSASNEFVINISPASPNLKFNSVPTSITYLDNSKSVTAVSQAGSTGTITYSSSDQNVATVNASTGAITPKKAGTFTVSATIAAVSGKWTSQTITSTTITISRASRTLSITTDLTTVSNICGSIQLATSVTRGTGAVTFTSDDAASPAVSFSGNTMTVPYTTAGRTFKVTAIIAQDDQYEEVTANANCTIVVTPLTIKWKDGADFNQFNTATHNFDLSSLVESNYQGHAPAVTFSFCKANESVSGMCTITNGKMCLYKTGTMDLTANVAVTGITSPAGLSKNITVNIGTLIFNPPTGSDNKWTTAANWEPHRDIIPDATNFNAQVIADCFIGKDPTPDEKEGDETEWLTHRVDAACHNLTIDGTDAKVVIGEASTLRVAGDLTNTDASKLVLTANNWGQASVVFGSGSPKATVEMYLPKGNGSRTDPRWHYRGIEVSSSDFVAVGNAWEVIALYEWNEEDNNNLQHGCWEVITKGNTSASNFHLSPWTGYAFANMSNEHIWLRYTGTLLREEKTVNLGYSHASENYANLGNNLITNSYTVPLRVDGLEFCSTCQHEIVLYNAGSYAAWSKGVTITDARGTIEGQFSSIPNISGSKTTGITTIPAGQSFFVKANATGQTFKMKYGNGFYELSPSDRMYLPGKNEEPEFNILTINVTAEGDSAAADRLYLIECDSCSRQYDNGYDGMKRFGNSGLPQLYGYNKFGNTALNADSTFNKQYVGFAAGSDDETYTISFETDRLFGYHSLYLVDRKLNETVDILAGETYSFKGYTVGENTRFQINGMTIEEYENQEKGENDEVADLCDLRVVGNTLFVEGFTAEHYKAANIEIFDMTGNMVWSTALTVSRVYDLPALPQGVYTIRLGDCHVKYGVR